MPVAAPFPYSVRPLHMLLLLACLAAPAASAAPGDPEMGHIFLQTHLPDDYGRSGQVFAIVQDTNQVIYAGAGDGLVTWDGAVYRTLEATTDKSVRSLERSASGRIYVGYRRDIAVLEPGPDGRPESVSLLDSSLRTGGVWDLWYSHAQQDTIWFASEKDLYRWKPDPSHPEGGRMKRWSFDSDDPIQSIIELQGRIYFDRSSAGLWCIEGDSARPCEGMDALKEHSVKGMLPWRGDDYLVSASRSSLLIFDWSTGELRPFDTEAGRLLDGVNCRALTEVDSQRIAVATVTAGVVLFDRQGRVLQRIDEREGLHDNFVSRAVVDASGALLIPSYYGFYRAEISSPVERFDSEDGIAGSVYAMVRFGGELYVGTSGGLHRLVPSTEAGRPARFEQVDGIEDAIWNLLPTPDRLFVPTVGPSWFVEPSGRAWSWDGEPRFVLATARTPDSQWVFLGEFRRDFYIARRTREGFRIAKKLQLPTVLPLNMVYEEDGEIWLSGDSRVIIRMRFARGNGEWRHLGTTLFDTSRGLPAGRYQSFVLHGQRYWGNVDGLYRHDEAEDSFVPADPFGLEELDVRRGFSRPVVSSKGEIWFSREEEGGYRLAPDGEGGWTLDHPFARADAGSVVPFLPEEDGVAWAGAVGSRLYRFVEEKAGNRHPVPGALIRVVRTVDDSVIFGGLETAERFTPRLSHAQNQVRFEYALPSYAGASENEYQYRLVGLSEDWSDWSSESYKDFTNLGGGDFRFEVRGRDHRGRVSEAAAFSFSVAPPWYLSGLAWVTYALLLVALVASISWLRTRRIETERRRLAALIEERTEEALAQYDRAKQAEIEAKQLKVANQLAATIAHEFNNPMAIIQGSMDAIDLGITGKEQQRLYRERVRAQIARMKGLVNKLLRLEDIVEIDYAQGVKILDIHSREGHGPSGSGDDEGKHPPAKRAEDEGAGAKEGS